MPYREQNSNKRTFGKVLNFAGSKNYYGAAYLSSLSVLKIGAGYLSLSAEKNIIKAVSVLLPESVFLSEREGLRNMEKFDVIMIGCGLGQSFKSKRLFKKVLRQACKFDKPIVIDADGLNILAEMKKYTLPSITIITPHPLEAARLLNISLEEVLNNTENCAKQLSQKYRCTTVLKLHRTIVCNIDGTIYKNEYGNSALAKAGSGDVLTGIISGLLAQKTEPFEAAKLGVYLHSRAGEIASENLTEYSVLASDLPKYLPQAIKEINQQS